MKITICRKAHFNAAHKLYNPALSNDENFEIFGKCSYENFHGHNYELIVKILGDIDPKTGMLQGEKLPTLNENASDDNLFAVGKGGSKGN